MSIKDVGASASQQTTPVTHQSKTRMFAGKEIVTDSSVAVNISEEALARGMEGHPPLTKEEIEKNTRAMAEVRNANMAAVTREWPKPRQRILWRPGNRQRRCAFYRLFSSTPPWRRTTWPARCIRR